jgi:hypothetical protein
MVPLAGWFSLIVAYPAICSCGYMLLEELKRHEYIFKVLSLKNDGTRPNVG